MKYLGNKNEFAGLELIEVNCRVVTLTSDEVTAVCPVTGQPDYYTASITINGGYSIESKSLKLYYQSLRNEGIFCENLAGKIKDDVLALDKDFDNDDVLVVVSQKSRGGISIEAAA